MNIGVIIPAAGRGTRMKSNINKQYIKLLNKPVITHTLDLFYNDERIKDIVLVIKDTEVSYCQKNILEKYNFNNVHIVAGGKTRKESVFAGLMAFSPAIDYVIIHDGARPLLNMKIIERVVNNLDKYKAITTGVEVKDTIKIKDSNNFVYRTMDRNRLVAIQTPQAFSYKLILKAHREFADVEVSDDASLVEKMGQPVKIVKGSYENIKITTPEDLNYARLILKNRGK